MTHKGKTYEINSSGVDAYLREQEMEQALEEQVDSQHAQVSEVRKPKNNELPETTKSVINRNGHIYKQVRIGSKLYYALATILALTLCGPASSLPFVNDASTTYTSTSLFPNLTCKDPSTYTPLTTNFSRSNLTESNSLYNRIKRNSQLSTVSQQSIKNRQPFEFLSKTHPIIDIFLFIGSITGLYILLAMFCCPPVSSCRQGLQKLKRFLCRETQQPQETDCTEMRLLDTERIHNLIQSDPRCFKCNQTTPPQITTQPSQSSNNTDSKVLYISDSNQVEPNPHSKQVFITGWINGKKQNMLVDTGSSITILPRNMVYASEDPLNFESPTTSAWCYNKRPINFLASVQVTIIIGWRRERIRAQMAEFDGTFAILGADLLERLNSFTVDYKNQKLRLLDTGTGYPEETIPFSSSSVIPTSGIKESEDNTESTSEKSPLKHSNLAARRKVNPEMLSLNLVNKRDTVEDISCCPEEKAEILSFIHWYHTCVKDLTPFFDKLQSEHLDKHRTPWSFSVHQIRNDLMIAMDKLFDPAVLKSIPDPTGQRDCTFWETMRERQNREIREREQQRIWERIPNQKRCEMFQQLPHRLSDLMVQAITQNRSDFSKYQSDGLIPYGMRQARKLARLAVLQGAELTVARNNDNESVVAIKWDNKTTKHPILKIHLNEIFTHNYSLPPEIHQLKSTYVVDDKSLEQQKSYSNIDGIRQAFHQSPEYIKLKDSYDAMRTQDDEIREKEKIVFGSIVQEELNPQNKYVEEYTDEKDQPSSPPSKPPRFVRDSSPEIRQNKPLQIAESGRSSPETSPTPDKDYYHSSWEHSSNVNDSPIDDPEVIPETPESSLSPNTDLSQSQSQKPDSIPIDMEESELFKKRKAEQHKRIARFSEGIRQSAALGLTEIPPTEDEPKSDSKPDLDSDSQTHQNKSSEITSEDKSSQQGDPTSIAPAVHKSSSNIEKTPTSRNKEKQISPKEPTRKREKLDKDNSTASKDKPYDGKLALGCYVSHDITPERQTNIREKSDPIPIASPRKQPTVYLAGVGIPNRRRHHK